MPVVTLGDIGATVTSAQITKIEVKDDIGLHTLYDGVSKHSVDVAVGASWELRVSTRAHNTAGLWATAVTVVSSIGKDGKNARNTTSGTVDRAFDFSMGIMPSTAVTIDRVKFWTSEYWTTGLPSENEW